VIQAGAFASLNTIAWDKRLFEKTNWVRERLDFVAKGSKERG